MCGIYVVAAPKAAQKAWAGLKRLEYRGYDSWGIATLANQKITVKKQVGKMGDQSPELPDVGLALAHTRWATHGGVTQANAHPHLASDGSFALAQNGVVENFQELKAQLLDAGYQFASQTDTEVIVHLIEETAKKMDKSIDLSVVAAAFSELTGRNTIALITKSGEIIAVRNGSPLVVGRNHKGEIFLSSDVLSMAADATEYLAVDSGQAVSVMQGQVVLWQIDTLEELTLSWQKIDLQATKLDKGGFDHFMLKEIHDQATVLTQVVDQPVSLCQEFIQILRQAGRIYTLGSGGASFSAAFIAYELRLAGLAALELKAYESRSYRGNWSPDDVAIVISQSGESADTLEVVEWMKAAGMKVASLVNMPGSTITRLADYPFMLQVGPEIGVASTKAMAGQMTWGIMLSKLLAGVDIVDIKSQVATFQSQLAVWLADQKVQATIDDLVHQLQDTEHLYVLGRGRFFPSVLEFALKLKEISYCHAEGFSGGELKHGPIALISEGSFVVGLVGEDEDRAEMLNALAQVKARGAKVIGVASEHNQLFDIFVPLPKNQDFGPISAFIPAQLLTYRLAVLKGFDPDKPRNLAKSVTVK